MLSRLRNAFDSSALPGIAILAVFFAQQSIASLLVPLGRASQLSDQALGGIMSMSSVCFVVGSVLWGFLAGTMRADRLLTLGFSGAAIGLVIFAAALNLTRNGLLASDSAFWMALVGRSIIFGMAASVVPIVSQSFALTLDSPRTRQLAVSNIGLAYSLSGICGPAVGAALFVVTPLAPLWAAPALIVFVGSLVVVVFRKHERSRPIIRSASGPRRSEGRSAIGLRAGTRLLAGVLLSCGSSCVIILFPFLLQDKFRLTSAESGPVIGISLTCAALAGLAGQILITRRWKWPPAALVLLGSVVQLAGAMLLVLSPSVVVTCGGVVLNAFGSAMSVPAYTLWIGSVVQAQAQARLAGYMEATNSLAPALVPLVGVAAYHWSPSAPFLAAAISFTCVTAWSMTTVAPRRAPHRG
ncbi:MFS transporter [Kribbella speibonae]|uniref:MFS transporter n=1 Tax=Kribbella speibonae TaxID=1572660 RepID=UPI0013F3A771|nr:MFS transporter [Kribbella speibonae]